MVKVIATLVAKADKIEETKAALSSLVDPTRDEPGCVSYQLFQSNDDPTEFVTVEEFTDDAAVDSHMASEHIGAALAAAPDILGADPKIKRYTLVK